MRRSNRARTRACAARADAPARPRRSAGVRQAEPVQHQRRGLVPRVVGAVAEADSRAPQTPRAGLDELRHGHGTRAPGRARAAAPGVRGCMK